MHYGNLISLSVGGSVILPAGIFYNGSFADLGDVLVNTDQTDDFDFTKQTNIPSGLNDGDDVLSES
ncbi:MAG: hypothetical protein ACERIH_11445 [Labilibaculum antarcticum]